jgi:hypothetical protein
MRSMEEDIGLEGGEEEDTNIRSTTCEHPARDVSPDIMLPGRFFFTTEIAYC